MDYNADIRSFCLSICIARQMARVYGENQARAITRAARKLRDQTKHPKVYELAKFYANDVDCKTVDGERLTGDQAKVYSVTRLQLDMERSGIV